MIGRNLHYTKGSNEHSTTNSKPSTAPSQNSSLQQFSRDSCGARLEVKMASTPSGHRMSLDEVEALSVTNKELAEVCAFTQPNGLHN
jgi:hypothetical protein